LLRQRIYAGLSVICEITFVKLLNVFFTVLRSIALLISERFEGEIHLLLSDVVMPEMRGRELVERLAGAQPHMRVLFMSGYTVHAMVQQRVLHGLSFLPKPFTPSATKGAQGFGQAATWSLR
jgi:DNA-binding NtrC family response regulator